MSRNYRAIAYTSQVDESLFGSSNGTTKAKANRASLAQSGQAIISADYLATIKVCIALTLYLHNRSLNHFD